jgi:hypothetical protein
MEFYRLPKSEKQLIFKQIHEDMSIHEASIEKDWWVVQTLALVFQTSAAPHLVFKGGTSLSKAWGIIERFSEDVDLALSYEFLGFSDNSSRTQITKLRDASFKYISKTFLPELRLVFQANGFSDVEIDLTQVASPDQDPVTILVKYQSVTEKNQYILPGVKLEIGSHTMREPFTNRSFSSYVGEKFASRSFADQPIILPCVNPERTLLEKLFLLQEEFQRPVERIRVERLSRHLYDIYRIWNAGYAEVVLKNQELYRSIVTHRERFTRLHGVNYSLHYPPNLNPLPPTEYLDAWEADYKTMQQQMIYGEDISFVKLMTELKAIIQILNKLQF